MAARQLRLVQSFPSERRGAVRAPVTIGAGLRRLGHAGEPATILDISTHGCRLDTSEAVAVGANIWLKLTGHVAKPVFAHVVWADGFLIGCEFVTPLSDSIVARLAGDD